MSTKITSVTGLAKKQVLRSHGESLHKHQSPTTLLVGKAAGSSILEGKERTSNVVYYRTNSHFEVEKFIQEVIGKDNQVSWREDRHQTVTFG